MVEEKRIHDIEIGVKDARLAALEDIERQRDEERKAKILGQKQSTKLHKEMKS